MWSFGCIRIVIIHAASAAIEVVALVSFARVELVTMHSFDMFPQ